MKETQRNRRSDAYTEYFEQNLMGPNCIRLLDELLSKYESEMSTYQTILDLGCGNGLSSLYIAKETGATIYANDLWNSTEKNAARFDSWGIGESVIPSQEDANELHFEKEFFDAIISIDSYHYFAGKEGFFREKILPFIKPDGMALIAIPGIKEEFEGRQQELIGEWIGEDYDMFHSCNWWKAIIGESEEIEFVKTWELENSSIAWTEWFDMNNKHSINDAKYYDSVIKPYTTFVGIAVKRK